MNKYDLFLSNAAVINIKSESEFKEFSDLMLKLGKIEVTSMNRIYLKYGFEKGFCYSAGIKKYDISELCFEYQLGKGFTYSSIDEWKKYDSEILILSLDEIKIATGYAIKIDDRIFNKPPNPPALIYMRFSTEEEFKKFYKVDVIEKKVEDLDYYKKIDGFCDLRNLDITKDKFKELWKYQLYLDSYDSNKKMIAYMPNLWERIQEISNKYEKEISLCKNKDDIEIEM